MSPDAISVAVRGAAFMLLFQTSGAVFFVALYGRQLSASIAPIRRLTLLCALVGSVCIGAHIALEAARMSGEFSGVFDLQLQLIALKSSLGASQALQICGLLFAGFGLRHGSRSGMRCAVSGAFATLIAFLWVGHTTTHSPRTVLAFSLLLHVAVVAFWFGALLPLSIVLRTEPLSAAAATLQKFSVLASRLVPLILLAGAAMALGIASGVPSFHEPYGRLLLLKLCGYVTLIALAALNRWHWVPALVAHRDTRAALQRSLLAEFALIIAVLFVTAAMTALYSPGE